MPDEFSIRPWRDDENAAFLELYQKIFPEKKITPAIIDRIRNEPATVWLIQQQQLSGFLYFWTVADELQIIDVGILPGERRKGHGRRLIEHLLRYGVTENKKITLEVRSRNLAAIALYETCGFRRMGARLGYYTDGEDALLFERTTGA